MSRVREYIERINDSNWIPNLVFGTLIASIVTLGGLGIYSAVNSNPNPPVYRDVNGDGVDDKIVQRRVSRSGFLGMNHYSLEEEVLFGIEIGGKKLYLTKDQFDDSRK